MDAMIVYSTSMLQAVATFLGSEPIIYLFGLICLTILVKAIKNIIT